MNEKYSAAAKTYTEKYFVRDWEGIFDAPESDEDYIALLGPSFYVLHLDGRLIAVDPVIRNKSAFSSVESRIAADFGKLDAVLITHAHIDHFDTKVTSAAADTDTLWYITEEFSEKRLAESGLDSRKIVRVKSGDSFMLGKIEVAAFAVTHTDENGSNYTPELGYFIKSQQKRLLFPADVRNYSVKLPDFGEIDVAFLHVWLGRRNALNFPCEPWSEKLSSFAAGINPKKIMLGHLYETGRSLPNMWTYTHAGEVMDSLLCVLPDTEVIIPKHGRRYRL